MHLVTCSHTSLKALLIIKKGKVWGYASIWSACIFFLLWSKRGFSQVVQIYSLGRTIFCWIKSTTTWHINQFDFILLLYFHHIVLSYTVRIPYMLVELVLFSLLKLLIFWNESDFPVNIQSFISICKFRVQCLSQIDKCLSEGGLWN